MFVSPADRGGRLRVPRGFQPALGPTPYVPPVLESFAWVNQGGATALRTSNKGIQIRAPANTGDNMRILIQPCPAVPYVVTAFFQIDLPNINARIGGMCWRESGSGKLACGPSVVRSNVFTDSKFESSNFNSPSSFNTATALVFHYAASGSAVVGMRAQDDGTNRIASFSVNGSQWETLLSEGRTSFITADQIGWFANCTSNSWYSAITCLSWDRKPL